MAISNHERVGRGLEVLKGIQPFLVVMWSNWSPVFHSKLDHAGAARSPKIRLRRRIEEPPVVLASRRQSIEPSLRSIH